MCCKYLFSILYTPIAFDKRAKPIPLLRSILFSLDVVFTSVHIVYFTLVSAKFWRSIVFYYLIASSCAKFCAFIIASAILEILIMGAVWVSSLCLASSSALLISSSLSALAALIFYAISSIYFILDYNSCSFRKISSSCLRFYSFTSLIALTITCMGVIWSGGTGSAKSDSLSSSECPSWRSLSSSSTNLDLS